MDDVDFSSLLDLRNLAGVTAEEFVERNRKAALVMLFQRAFAGNKEAIGIIGKIVSAPFVERSKMLAISNGKAVGFEGLMSGPLGGLLKDMHSGKVKTDDLIASSGGDLRRSEVFTNVAVESGDHMAAVEDRERRQKARRPIQGYEHPAPGGMMIGDDAV